MSEQIINAVVIDDEKLARQYLTEMLKEHDNINIVAQCSNGFEAVKAVNEHNPQMIFLDIQMPKLDGFEVLELLQRDDIAVVFVTAYDQYALQAFDSHAVDYLLKPFSKERLKKAIEKVVKNIGQGLPEISQMREVITPDVKFLSRIVVKDGASINVIPAEEIIYVSAEDDYVNIASQKGSLLKHETLSNMEKSLDPSQFVRIHRSSLINISYLEKIESFTKESYIAVLKDGTELRISRAGHKRLKQLIASQ